MRQGFEIRTAVRFSEHEGRPSYRTGMVQQGEEVLATLTYGHAATLWRINMGWMRRKDKNQYGFVLDKERGYWAKNDETADDPDDPLSPRTERVIPYVEDRRNCLLFQPEYARPANVMASLQAILKSALQVKYQLEDNELAAEPLPASSDRQLILLYESAEGGAGVLRRLLDEPYALAEVAREGLRLCHFDPETGTDLRRAPRAQEDCEAACYDCLMNYYNQREHLLLDRQAIRDELLNLAQAHVVAGPTEQPRPVHLEQLLRLMGTITTMPRGAGATRSTRIAWRTWAIPLFVLRRMRTGVRRLPGTRIFLGGYKRQVRKKEREKRGRKRIRLVGAGVVWMWGGDACVAHGGGSNATRGTGRGRRKRPLPAPHPPPPLRENGVSSSLI